MQGQCEKNDTGQFTCSCPVSCETIRNGKESLVFTHICERYYFWKIYSNLIIKTFKLKLKIKARERRVKVRNLIVANLPAHVELVARLPEIGKNLLSSSKFVKGTISEKFIVSQLSTLLFSDWIEWKNSTWVCYVKRNQQMIIIP